MKERSEKGVFKAYTHLPKEAKAAIWFFVCSLLQKGISVICTPIFTRILSTDEFGRYNVFDSWLQIITIFVTLRIYSGSYTQGLVKYENNWNVYTSSIQGLVLTLCLLWSVLYFIFHDSINILLNLSTPQMISMIVLIWATAVFNLWAAEKRVSLEYKSLVVLTIIVSLAKPIVGIIFIIMSTDKVMARILALTLVEFIGYSWIFFISIRKGKTFFNAIYWKRAILLNTPLILHYLSQTVLNSSNRIMIARMVNDDKAGIYSLAGQISTVMTIFGSTLTLTLTPWIYKKIKAGNAKDVIGISYMSLIIVGTVNIFLILIAPEIVYAFAPNTYKEALWIISPLAIGTLFTYSYDLFSKIEFYYEKTAFIMVASVIGAILNIGLNFLLIPVAGYMVTAYVTLICMIIYAIAHYLASNYLSHKNLGYSLFEISTLIKGASFFVALSLFIQVLYNYTILRYAIICIIGLIILYHRKLIRKKLSLLNSIRKHKM